MQLLCKFISRSENPYLATWQSVQTISMSKTILKQDVSKARSKDRVRKGRNPLLLAKLECFMEDLTCNESSLSPCSQHQIWDQGQNLSDLTGYVLIQTRKLDHLPWCVGRSTSSLVVDLSSFDKKTDKRTTFDKHVRAFRLHMKNQMLSTRRI